MAYHGVKFKTKIIGASFPISSQIDELMSWCNLFAKNGLAPSHPEGTYGNLSIRMNDGILITATSLDLGKKLQYSDFIFVQNCDFELYEMTVMGNRAPSSESPIHWTMYKLRPEINAVFHGHHDTLLSLAKELQIPETVAEQDYGSPALVNEVKKLAHYDFFNMKNHGFISMGKTMEEAGNLALGYLDKLAK
jgi:ribulose-5-phosphate 4-epimerase/fuculose-1-phosphate aldolase